ncbi:MAG TPA: hypothetical protein VK589_25475 [Chryseolinea sp.]|nr:hypothetical protein [Chryseolinea sp.]
MNRILMLVIVASLSPAVETSAQSASFDSLYWVVETNIHNPSYTIVRFYNYRNLMVHEVRLQGVYLNICSPRQRKKLDSLMKEYSQRVVTSKEVGAKYTVKVSSKLLSRRGQL